MKNFPEKITVIGLGLIGGSLALGLKKRLGEKIRITGINRSIDHARKAKSLGIVDEVLSNSNLIPGDTDLIAVAAPVLKITGILTRLKKISAKKCLIIDVGSTKLKIVKQAQKLAGGNFHFLGTHPMAGSEKSGIEHADPNLFINKPWIICPTRNNNRKEIADAEKIIKLLGGNIIIMKAAEHDKIIAFSSHIAQIMGNLIISASSGSPHWNKIAQTASTGFRDSTRLAGADPEMKNDMIISNRANISKTLDAIKEEIGNFQKNILPDDKKILEFLTITKTVRDNWIRNYFS